MRNRLDFYSQPHPKGTPQLHSWWVVVKEFLTGPAKWLELASVSLPMMRLILFLFCSKKQRCWLYCYKATLEHKRQTNMFKLKKSILYDTFHTPIILKGSMSCCGFSVHAANDQ